MNLLEQEMQDRVHPAAEDLTLQRKVWRFQRVGWFVLMAVVILTLLGLFSRGPLSTLEAVSKQDNLTVQYERFHRAGGTNPMIVQATGRPGKDVTLSISKPMLDGFSIESIQPQPISSVVSPQGLSLTFPTDKSGHVTLFISWRSNGIGLFKSQISVVGGGHIPVTQFIYP
ncbi:hypothetical protein JN403_11405 [Pseudomonas sp. 15A4]|uniref:hypothetical protein n=1 Tax=Pseudomonas sp. 15A4 TaxID=2804761 RepID=UPI0019678DD1|nr:hypothetical protein [Pseudomonas sp. 15A4]QSB21383.1 hypothetical protein JN403_11405 [Pseudomonas sp. 15A4]